MAGDGEEENDYYESDPEEAKMSLKMRRREASDDEESVDDVTHQSRDDVIASDGDSGGQGGAGEYDRDGEGEEEVEVDGEEYYEDERGGFEDVNGGEEARGVEKEVKGEGEKKENEPFAVPTSGAFYMHDDRFRGNAGGRQRKTFSGRRLWESKDNRKWGHDKFDEMSMQERHYEENYQRRSSSRGYYRGLRKGRGTGRGNVMVNRMRVYNGSDNPNLAPKDVRGRGPKRYQPSMNIDNETRPPQNRRSAKFSIKTSHAGFGTNSASSTSHHAEHEVNPAVKVLSNLNYASPPFYPSVSTLVQNKDLPGENHKNRSPRSTFVERNFSVPLSNPVSSGKSVDDCIGMEKLHIDENAVQNRARSSFQHLGHGSYSASRGSPIKEGKRTVQGDGMGSVLYSGAQVMGSSGGNIGAGNGDHNRTAFFPFMQLGAQHPGGIGVPAVGMAFPGYVSQPNGGGNSEMTWLPVLASAASALGAPYSPPYLPSDGTYHSRSLGQTSALPASSKYINRSRPDNEVKPLQRYEVSNDEFSQRQNNKPRRYSEMNITQ